MQEKCSICDIFQIESLVAPLQFHPVKVFDETKHVIDVVAKEYLEKSSDDVQHLCPVDVPANGNCLYHSIQRLIDNLTVTTDELRGMMICFMRCFCRNILLNKFLVRTIIELTMRENYYNSMYSQYVGPVHIAIRSVCKNYTFSELYEIAALCNILQCNIRSVYPKIDFQSHMALWDSVFTPVLPTIANCTIMILWSSGVAENDVRTLNNGTWSPNHFVPLLLPDMNDQSDHNGRPTLKKGVSYTVA